MPLYQNQNLQKKLNEYVDLPKQMSSLLSLQSEHDPYSAYVSLGGLESGDLVQFAWQIASGMVSRFFNCALLDNTFSELSAYIEYNSS